MNSNFLYCFAWFYWLIVLIATVFLGKELLLVNVAIPVMFILSALYQEVSKKKPYEVHVHDKR